MELGIHIISEGKQFRELIEVFKVGNKKESRTFHQEKINNQWKTRETHKQIHKKAK